MTNDELKDKQEQTLNQLKKYNKQRKTEIVDDRSIASVDEVAELQNEASSMLSRDSKPRDIQPIKSVEVKAEIKAIRHPIPGLLDDDTDDLDNIDGPRDFFEDEDEQEKPLISHICPYCGQLAYQNQLHGLGYCKEKTQYEQ